MCIDRRTCSFSRGTLNVHKLMSSIIKEFSPSVISRFPQKSTDSEVSFGSLQVGQSLVVGKRHRLSQLLPWLCGSGQKSVTVVAVLLPGPATQRYALLSAGLGSYYQQGPGRLTHPPRDDLLRISPSRKYVGFDQKRMRSQRLTSSAR